MAIPLPHHLFIYFHNLPLIQLGIGDLTIMVDLFSVLSGIRNLTAVANLFSVLSIRDLIFLAYLFLLSLSLESPTISLYLFILRDLIMSLCLLAIGLLSSIIEDHLFIILLLL